MNECVDFVCVLSLNWALVCWPHEVPKTVHLFVSTATLQTAGIMVIIQGPNDLVK